MYVHMSCSEASDARAFGVCVCDMCDMMPHTNVNHAHIYMHVRCGEARDTRAFGVCVCV